MKSREDVIKGLECHKRAMYGEIDEYGFSCNQCPYKDMETTCRSMTEGDLISDAIELLKEYDDALKLMVYQYCTMKPLTVNDEVFHNKFMSAGEAAFRLLGLENWQSTDGVWERWFPNG